MFHAVLYEFARLPAAIVLDEAAELAPIKLHAARTVHRLAAPLQEPFDSALYFDGRRHLPAVNVPFGHCSLQLVHFLGARYGNGSLFNLGKATAPLEHSSTAQELLY